LALEGKFTISSGNAKAEVEKNNMAFKNPRKYIKGVAIKIESKVKSLDFYKYIE
jgi:hypothetical protein